MHAASHFRNYISSLILDLDKYITNYYSTAYNMLRIKLLYNIVCQFEYDTERSSANLHMILKGSPVNLRMILKGTPVKIHNYDI
jgi:hypothetical protein